MLGLRRCFLGNGLSSDGLPSDGLFSDGLFSDGLFSDGLFGDRLLGSGLGVGGRPEQGPVQGRRLGERRAVPPGGVLAAGPELGNAVGGRLEVNFQIDVVLGVRHPVVHPADVGGVVAAARVALIAKLPQAPLADDDGLVAVSAREIGEAVDTGQLHVLPGRILLGLGRLVGADLIIAVVAEIVLVEGDVVHILVAGVVGKLVDLDTAVGWVPAESLDDVLGIVGAHGLDDIAPRLNVVAGHFGHDVEVAEGVPAAVELVAQPDDGPFEGPEAHRAFVEFLGISGEVGHGGGVVVGFELPDLIFPGQLLVP